MKIVVLAEDGSAIWERDTLHGSGLASAGYLIDGTQERIASALSEALAEAQGQLLGSPLQVLDVVADVSSTAAQIDCHVPEAGTRNGYPRRQHLVETAVKMMLPAASETLEIRVVSEPDVALVVAGHNDNVSCI